MIYISYGITKSATTFVYELTQEIFRAAGRSPKVLSTKLRGFSPENYVDPITGEAIDAIRNEISEADVVVKTHGAPDARLLHTLETGKVLASAVIRDPREIALAMVDHGQRSRATGAVDLAEFGQPLDTINSIRTQFQRLQKWTESKAVLVLTYNEVCFETEKTIDRIARQIGVEIDQTSVLRAFENKSIIRQFNKGIRGRYKEMDDDLQAVFLNEFAEVYRTWQL